MAAVEHLDAEREEDKREGKSCVELLECYSTEIKNMFGVRIVYFDPDSPSTSDHSDQHNKDWNDAIKNGCLECGTITQMSVEEGTPVAKVFWDCGVVKTYIPGLWQYLRVYNLGPAGYLGQMVFCDKCLKPSMGLAFRLTREGMRVGVLYDLCHQCYNECDDEHVSSRFYCNIPSGNIDLEDSKREKNPQEPRQNSRRLKVVGIFEHALVETNKATNTGLSRGEVLNIVHEGGHYDLRKAIFYECCAEVKMDTTGSEKLPLEYREAGSGGKVELKALKPGEAPFTMPVEHYPTLGAEIIEEMLTYKKKLIKINKNEAKECDCFMRFKDRWCYSLTISGTNLNRITDSEIWKRCKDLRIVILLMNELNDLPQKLRDFSDSVELVCIQHNKFTKVPPILYDLTLIKHLNLHGNQISKFPDKMQVFVNLERLKFGHNKLYSLPNIFRSFQQLTEITFNDNFLTRLPPSFAELKQLESIDLRNNSFTCIPTPLLALPELRVLYMDWNRIQRLAPLEDRDGNATFKLIQRLVSLKLKGNPVIKQLKPGCDVLKQVQDCSIFSDLHSCLIFRALRVLVLGSCGAGKTSIVKALSFDEYVTPTSEAHHDHTVGIDRFSIPVQLKAAEGKDLFTELRLWDFAGERSYIMMNSLFLTDSTLIWIAVNFQTYTCTDMSFNENVASWLEQVITKAVRPIIWVIGTHTDKCKKQEIEEKVQHIKKKIEDRCEMFQEELRNELYKLENERQSKYRSPECTRKNIEELKKLTDKNVPCFVAEHLNIIPLTNTYSFSGFEKLKYHIEHLPFFIELTKPLTESELKATDKLRKKAEELLANKKVPLLPNEEVLEIIKTELGDPMEAKKFLHYLHQSGHLLVCESEPEIILDVDWLIDLLAQVFHHDFPTMVDNKKVNCSFNKLDSENIQRAVSIQQKLGIVENQLLEALWSDALPLSLFNHFLEILQHYGLAYKVDYGYLFPWLVASSCPKSVPSNVHNQHRVIRLVYNFAPCLPPCFLQQLVVKCKEQLCITSQVYTDSFIVSVSVPVSNDHRTVLAVHISQSISCEPNKVCGKIELDACVEQENIIKQHPSLIKGLWKILMKIIEKMEHLLCNWTFYGNLQRRVCCPECFYPSWDLEIRKSRETNFEPVFECIKCDKCIIDLNCVLVPEDLRLGFVDHKYPDLAHSNNSAQSSPSSSSLAPLSIQSTPETTCGPLSHPENNSCYVYPGSQEKLSKSPSSSTQQSSQTVDQLSVQVEDDQSASRARRLLDFVNPPSGTNNSSSSVEMELHPTFYVSPVPDSQQD